MKEIALESYGEIRFAAIWRVIVHRKYLVTTFVVMFTTVAIVLAYTAIPRYRADIVVAQVHDSNFGGSAGSVVGQLSGLASLAGVNLGSGMVSHDAIAVLKSRHLIEDFINKYHLLPALFQGNSKHSTICFGVEKFATQVLTIHEDPREGVTTVSILWTDPVTAARWANDFVALANELLREHDLDEASRNVAYLKDQIAKTNDIELQRVLYNLIQSESKTLMLANARRDYAFRVIDPAVAPEQRVSPKRTLIAAAGFLAGLLCGVLVALAMNVFAGEGSDEDVARIRRVPTHVNPT